MVVFLIMPARERTLNYEHNQEMQSYTDKLNLANQETDKLKLQVEDYQKQKEDAEGQLNDLKGDSGSTVNQYAALAKILDAYRKGDTNTAVLTYVDMDQSKITDDSSVAILKKSRRTWMPTPRSPYGGSSPVKLCRGLRLSAPLLWEIYGIQR